MQYFVLLHKGGRPIKEWIDGVSNDEGADLATVACGSEAQIPLRGYGGWRGGWLRKLADELEVGGDVSAKY